MLTIISLEKIWCLDPYSTKVEHMTSFAHCPYCLTQLRDKIVIKSTKEFQRYDAFSIEKSYFLQNFKSQILSNSFPLKKDDLHRSTLLGIWTWDCARRTHRSKRSSWTCPRTSRTWVDSLERLGPSWISSPKICTKFGEVSSAHFSHLSNF